MEEDKEEPMHIEVKNLTYGYAGCEPVLRDFNMTLSGGARCLLIGANGGMLYNLFSYNLLCYSVVF
jgi:ABC-type bacteriocin/lantibiotic exporter with double-glycine peptidase domain